MMGGVKNDLFVWRLEGGIFEIVDGKDSILKFKYKELEGFQE